MQKKLTKLQAFHAMLNYLQIYRSFWGETEDLDTLIQEIKYLYEEYNIKTVMWQKWFEIADDISIMQNPRVQKSQLNNYL